MEDNQLTRPDPKAVTILRPGDLANALEWKTIPVGLIEFSLSGDQDKWRTVTDLSDFLRYVNYLYEFNRLVLDPRYETRSLPKTLAPQRSRLAWEDQLKLRGITKQSPWELLGSMLASHSAIVSVGATGLLLLKAFDKFIDLTKRTAEAIKAIEEAKTSRLRRREEQLRLTELETAIRKPTAFSTGPAPAEGDSDPDRAGMISGPPTFQVPINEDALRRIVGTGFRVFNFEIRVKPDDHPFRNGT